ncbi:MAG: transglutaminase domain-containing protein [Betaproteobacteria bacterium]
MELTVVHDTATTYGARVEDAFHLAFLAPRDLPGQQVLDFSLQIEPRPARQSAERDVFGNRRTSFALHAPHERLHVRAASRVLLTDAGAPLRPEASPPWGDVAAAMSYSAGAAFQPEVEFVYASPFVPLLPELRQYALASLTPRRPWLDAAIELMRRIHRDFDYESGATEIHTPLAEVFVGRHGVCQDFAHLTIGMLRAHGLPARYVSGYLLTHPPAGQERLVGADASHAWVQVWCPVHGWVDLDPTNDVLPARSHVTVAVGRDYGDVTPLRGVIRGGGEHEVEVAVSVIPASEADVLLPPLQGEGRGGDGV